MSTRILGALGSRLKKHLNDLRKLFRRGEASCRSYENRRRMWAAAKPRSRKHPSMATLQEWP